MNFKLVYFFEILISCCNEYMYDNVKLNRFCFFFGFFALVFVFFLQFYNTNLKKFFYYLIIFYRMKRNKIIKNTVHMKITLLGYPLKIKLVMEEQNLMINLRVAIKYKLFCKINKKNFFLILKKHFNTEDF